MSTSWPGGNNQPLLSALMFLSQIHSTAGLSREVRGQRRGSCWETNQQGCKTQHLLLTHSRFTMWQRAKTNWTNWTFLRNYCGIVAVLCSFYSLLLNLPSSVLISGVYFCNLFWTWPTVTRDIIIKQNNPHCTELFPVHFTIYCYKSTSYNNAYLSETSSTHRTCHDRHETLSSPFLTEIKEQHMT